MLSSNKIDLLRDFAAGVYLSKAPNPIPSPLAHAVYVYTVYLFTQGWGGERQQFTKVDRKYQHDCLYLQSITLINTCRKVP